MFPLTALVLLVFGSFALPTSAETMACAHRGDTVAAPENTVPAFESAVRKGAHMIEFDIYGTSDGRLIVIHDSTVNRTTNGEGKVNNMTFEELRALDAGSWFGPEFAGLQLPTLRETLEVIPRDIKCNVHIKYGDDIAAKSAQIIAEMDRLEQCFLACTTEDAEEAKKMVPMIQICNMSRQGGKREAYIKSTLDNNCEYIQLSHSQGMENLKEEVALLHENEVTVNWFGASTEEPIRALAEAGVDYILTDDLNLCLKVLADYGTEPLAVATATP